MSCVCCVEVQKQQNPPQWSDVLKNGSRRVGTPMLSVFMERHWNLLSFYHEFMLYKAFLTQGNQRTHKVHPEKHGRWLALQYWLSAPISAP